MPITAVMEGKCPSVDLNRDPLIQPPAKTMPMPKSTPATTAGRTLIFPGYMVIQPSFKGMYANAVKKPRNVLNVDLKNDPTCKTNPRRRRN